MVTPGAGRCLCWHLESTRAVCKSKTLSLHLEGVFSCLRNQCGLVKRVLLVMVTGWRPPQASGRCRLFGQGYELPGGSARTMSMGRLGLFSPSHRQSAGGQVRSGSTRSQTHVSSLGKASVGEGQPSRANARAAAGGSSRALLLLPRHSS